MPFVYAQNIDLEDIALIGFNNIRSNDSDANKSKTVHFFLDDHKFDEVWNIPERELARLSQYAHVLSPDFSVYPDMPIPLQMFNVFRNRWCASYWQFNAIAVIPTISWGDKRSYRFCFDGIERGCIVAISTLGTHSSINQFMHGFKMMCEIIKPRTVINYGALFEGMTNFADIVTIPYKHGSQRADS